MRAKAGLKTKFRIESCIAASGSWNTNHPSSLSFVQASLVRLGICAVDGAKGPTELYEAAFTNYANWLELVDCRRVLLHSTILLSPSLSARR